MEMFEHLRFALYMMYYVDDLENFTGLSSKQIGSIIRDYTSEEVEMMQKALKWSLANPLYDFSGILPGLLKYSNKEILAYFKMINREFDEIMAQIEKD